MGLLTPRSVTYLPGLWLLAILALACTGQPNGEDVAAEHAIGLRPDYVRSDAEHVSLRHGEPPAAILEMSETSPELASADWLAVDDNLFVAEVNDTGAEQGHCVYVAYDGGGDLDLSSTCVASEETVHIVVTTERAIAIGNVFEPSVLHAVTSDGHWYQEKHESLFAFPVTDSQESVDLYESDGSIIDRLP